MNYDLNFRRWERRRFGLRWCYPSWCWWSPSWRGGSISPMSIRRYRIASDSSSACRPSGKLSTTSLCSHDPSKRKKNPCPRIPLQVDPTRSKWGLQGSLKDPIKILENLRRISPLNVFNYSTNKQTNKQIPQELSIIHGLIHESVWPLDWSVKWNLMKSLN